MTRGQIEAEGDAPVRIVLTGLGRSGTSWLYKIFDHHPGVVGLFEPNLTPRYRQLLGGLRESGDEPTPEFYQRMSRVLFGCRALRVVRRRPIITKDFRSPLATHARLGTIFAMSAAAKAAGMVHGSFERRLRQMPVPDFADRSELPVVAKTVASGDLEMGLADYRQDVRTIVIVRHPCGFVRSRIRGEEIGAMPRNMIPRRKVMNEMFSRDYSKDVCADDAFSREECAAFRWAIGTRFVDPDAPFPRRARLVRYEDLCADPIGTAAELFDWAGLDFHEDCRAFLMRSVKGEKAHTGEASYHATVRDPNVAAYKWRETMDDADIARVMKIASYSPAAKLFPDVVERAAEVAATY